MTDDQLNARYFYLAGPMRRMREFNFPAFHAAAEDLRGRGLMIVSPAEMDANAGFDPTGMLGTDEELAACNFDLVKTLRQDIEVIFHPDCAGVICLPGWEASSGARMEVATAFGLGKAVFQYPTLAPVPNPTHDAKIREERQKVYGDPKENHTGIAMIWAPQLQPHWEAIRDMKPLPPHVVALLMVGLKYDRMRLAFHDDNYVDLRNYLRFAEDWQAGLGS